MMEFVNRIGVVIKPKPPYIDWANSFEDGGPKYTRQDHSARIYLLDEITDPVDFQRSIR